MHPLNSSIGSKSSKAENWTLERIYKDEKDRLRQSRKFVQYKPDNNQNVDIIHEQALDDIRALIDQYGEHGVWLWDPFLSANDILKTLFHCRFYGAKLRAITNLDAAPVESNSSEHNCVFDYLKLIFIKKSYKKTGRTNQLKIQKEIFDNLESNFYGIDFEFRAKIGSAGWNFHDRFLIFPETQQGTLAWSLGTSVNSVGKAHHILQQVDDGQLIADAFMELWDQLDTPNNLLWKKYP